MPKLYENQCEYCGNLYKGSSPKFCSRKCYSESKWIKRICRQCRKEFRTRKVYVKRGQMIYCSHECAAIASRKHKVIHFDGDTFYYSKAHGYFQSANTNRKLHRVIWEHHFGPIPDNYVIHHKDGDTTNNIIENLELVEWGQHTVNHNINRDYSIRLRQQCSEAGCNRPARARKLCTKHYQRLRAKEKGYWS